MTTGKAAALKEIPTSSVDEYRQNHFMMEILSQLLAVPSPGGREEQLVAIVQEKLNSWGIKHETDGAGNVIVRLAGRQVDAPLHCIAAHMDEIGIVVERINPDGSLCVNRSGKWVPWKFGEGPVSVLGDYGTITGVFSMGSTHTTDNISSCGTSNSIGWSGVQILTGLSAEKIKKAGVRPGSTAVPISEVRGPILFGDSKDPLIGCWTLDNRAGVVVLLRFLEIIAQRGITPTYPMLVAFTVQEEGGGYGAKVLAQREKPNVFIAVDGCPMLPETPLELDGRPGIWSKDGHCHYDQQLILSLSRAAKDVGTELQPVVYDYYGACSDASYAKTIGAAERIATIGYPRENSHGYDFARLSVFENLVKLLIQFFSTNHCGYQTAGQKQQKI